MFDFIATADIHITKQRPEKRKDNYLKTVLNKLEQIIQITKEQTHTNLLVVAGDFFDSPTVPYDVTRQVIKLIKKHNIEILTVPGQHDLRYHQTGLNNTPLGILTETGLVSTTNRTEFDMSLAGWNEEPKKEAEILLIHKMVTEEFGLFPGHDYTNAKQILKDYPWARLIISGDNHRPHLVEHKNRIQLNCGSVVRKRKDQIDYEPAVWGVKLGSIIGIKRFPLKIKPAKEVYDFSKIEKEENQEEIKNEAKKLIDKVIHDLGYDFSPENNSPKTVVQQIVNKINPTKQVKNKINEIMEIVSNG